LEYVGHFGHHLPLSVFGPLPVSIQLFQDVWRAENIQRDFRDEPPTRPGRLASMGEPEHLHFQVVFLDGRPHRFGLSVPDLKPHDFKQLVHLPSPLRPQDAFDVLLGDRCALVFQNERQLLELFAQACARDVSQPKADEIWLSQERESGCDRKHWFEAANFSCAAHKDASRGPGIR
jgi:hypothetical protein